MGLEGAVREENEQKGRSSCCRGGNWGRSRESVRGDALGIQHNVIPSAAPSNRWEKLPSSSVFGELCARMVWCVRDVTPAETGLQRGLWMSREAREVQGHWTFSWEAGSPVCPLPAPCPRLCLRSPPAQGWRSRSCARARGAASDRLP